MFKMIIRMTVMTMMTIMKMMTIMIMITMTLMMMMTRHVAPDRAQRAALVNALHWSI